MKNNMQTAIKLFGIGIDIKIGKEGKIQITRHAKSRIIDRISRRELIQIMMDLAIKHGEQSIFYNEKLAGTNRIAKKYGGYIWIFAKKNENHRLITVFKVSKWIDILVTRK